MRMTTGFTATGFDDNNQKLIRAAQSGDLKRRYESGESLSTIAVSLNTYSKAVREQLVAQGVRIRDKNETRRINAGSAKVDMVGASGKAEILTVLLKQDAISQSDIDALATPTNASVAMPTTMAEAAKLIDAIAKSVGANVTHKMMGQIFGYSPSWYANIKGRS